MDYKKTKAAITTVPRDLNELEAFTGNIYESLMVIAKRANQINAELKEELNTKLLEFATSQNNKETRNRFFFDISNFLLYLPCSEQQKYIQKFVDAYDSH